MLYYIHKLINERGNRSMRVSVTITDEMNEYFKKLAEEQGVSKDKVMGEILAKAVNPVHNERGAGRKSKFTEIEISKIIDMREQGQSIRQIAKEFDCSVGLIHKIINEREERERIKHGLWRSLVEEGIAPKDVAEWVKAHPLEE